jgi:hypothetical protein
MRFPSLIPPRVANKIHGATGTLSSEVFIDKPASELELNPKQEIESSLKVFVRTCRQWRFWYRELAQHHGDMDMKTLKSTSIWISQLMFYKEFREVMSKMSCKHAPRKFDLLTNKLSAQHDACGTMPKM